MTFGSLFSGIGGLDLGLERAGMRVIWQCEIDPYARRVLAKNWPGIPCYQDVREINGSTERPDIVCGGFPCQDISRAGRKAGIDGKQSGLWEEFARVLGILRPPYALVENSADLLDRGIGRVLGDLARLGFDAEWSVVSACAMGAPHLRERLFIVAYADRERFQARWAEGNRDDAPAFRRQKGARHVQAATFPGRGENGAHWLDEPGLDRMADGIPNGVDRLKRLGNAVVPQVAEWIGRRILESVTA